MKRNFVELQKFLETTFPQLTGQIRGANYPPPAYAQVAAQVAGLVQMAGFAMVLLGDKLFEWMGMPAPSWLGSLQENKLMCFAGLMMMNSVVASMSQTGAFEVTLNGQVVFSKLETNRMPTPAELVAKFESLGIMRPTGEF